MAGKTLRNLGLGATGATAVILGARRLVAAERQWGATQEEATRFMPGDDLVVDPGYRTTRAITVEAPPEAIFPWLKQMGYQRGGLYSYDFLDRLFGFLDAPSARQILPEFQRLREGDLIPLGRGAPFPVAELIENEAFVLADPEVGWSWSTCLYSQFDGTTRLVTRNRGRMDGRFARPAWFVLDLAAFVMVRRWLIVLKGRAEQMQADRNDLDSQLNRAAAARVTVLHPNER